VRKRSFFSFLLAALVLLIPQNALYAGGKKPDKPVIQKAPPLPGKGMWINPPANPGKFFDRKVTLVYFWDYTSINCLRDLGYIKNWYQHYRTYGFEVIMIHAPEFDFSKDKVNVEKAAKRLGLSFPIFLDNYFKLWDKYKTRSWPTKYIVDSNRIIVHAQVGEGGNMEFEKKIREALIKLIPEAGLPPPLVTQEENRFNSKKCGEMSTETYMGYERANWWGGEIATKKGVLPNQTLEYRDRGQRAERGFFVEGLWTNRTDDFEHARETETLSDYLGVIYLGHEVYTVINQSDEKEKPRIYVTRDDEPIPSDQRGSDIVEDLGGGTYVVLEDPRLYYLITNEDSEPHELKLWVQKKGVMINSFSFSNRCLSQFDHL